MTPPSELDRCSNCNCWFTAATQDEVFYHATAGCCRERRASAFTEGSPSRNVLSQRPERGVR